MYIIGIRIILFSQQFKYFKLKLILQNKLFKTYNKYISRLKKDAITSKIIKNLFSTFLFKGIALSISFLLFPLTISYLNASKYGIWMTLSSMVSWFSFFDLGLGNGLRNRLVEAKSIGDLDLAKSYVSTTYAMLILVGVVMIAILSLFNLYIDWNLLLNIDTNIVKQSELKVLILVIYLSFFSLLVLKLIGTILITNHKTAKVDLIDLSGQILVLLFLLILIKFSSPSIVWMGLIISAAPILVYIIVSVHLYNGEYLIYKPSIKYIDFRKIKNLFSLGLRFFFISIASIVLFSTNNFIILKILGPKQVTEYNVAFKYFGILTFLFTLILTPYWSAFTTAWMNKDFFWVKKSMKNLLIIWLGFVLIGLLMLFFSRNIYSIWIGKSVSVPFMTSLLVLLWVLINSFNGIYSHLFNGIGKLNVQIISLLITALLNLPLAFYFGEYFGINGILSVNVFLSLISSFIFPRTYYKIMKNEVVI